MARPVLPELRAPQALGCSGPLRHSRCPVIMGGSPSPMCPPHRLPVNEVADPEAVPGGELGCWGALSTSPRLSCASLRLGNQYVPVFRSVIMGTTHMLIFILPRAVLSG